MNYKQHYNVLYFLMNNRNNSNT